MMGVEPQKVSWTLSWPGFVDVDAVRGKTSLVLIQTGEKIDRNENVDSFAKITRKNL